MLTKDHSVCGEHKLERLAHFDAAPLLGSPFKVLLNDSVEQKVCTQCGKSLGVVVPKSHELLEIVAISRSCNPWRLSGADIRFLRKSIGLKAKQLAEFLGLTPQFFSKVENGHRPLNPALDMLLRLRVCNEFLDTAAYAGMLNKLSDLPNLKLVAAREIGEELTLELRLMEIEPYKLSNSMPTEPVMWEGIVANYG